MGSRVASDRTDVRGPAYNQCVPPPTVDPKPLEEPLRNATHTSRLRGASVFAFAAAGLVLGHALAYVLAVPDSHHRDLMLAQTGHDYLPAATQLAMILAFAGAAATAVHGILARDTPSVGWPALAARLAIVQVSAFIGQEVVERIATGAPLADLVQEHLLLAGVVTQFVVALIGAALLRWLTRSAAHLADATVVAVASPRLVPAFALPATPDLPRPRIVERASAQRAPPSR